MLIADLLDARSRLACSDAVRQHVTALIGDCHHLVNSELGLAASLVRDLSGLADHANACGAQQVIMPYVPAGHVADAMQSVPEALALAGVGFGMHRHAFDAVTWPHATAGFYKLKKQLPGLVNQLELISRSA